MQAKAVDLMMVWRKGMWC